MSQVITKQKRLWLGRILGKRAAKAFWLAPALFSPILFTAVESHRALGQVPGATRSITATETKIDTGYVLGWLEYAAKSEDRQASAMAWVEALRGRKLLGKSEPTIESRVREVEQILAGRGITPEEVQQAVTKLGEIAPAPKPAASNASALAQSPSPTIQGPASQGPAIQGPAIQGPAVQGPVSPALPVMPNGKPETVVQAGGAQPGLPALPPILTAANAGAQARDQAMAAAQSGNPSPVAAGVFFPQTDNTTMQPAGAQGEPPVPQAFAGESSGEELYRRGVELLGEGQRDAAYDHFRRAWQFNGEMTPAIRNQLKDKLSSMQAVNIGNSMEPVEASPLRQISEEERAMRQRMMTEVSSEIAAAEANRESEPQVVAERLQTLRIRVSQANLDAKTRKQLLTIVDRAITSHQIFMTQNRAAIDQDMRNRQITEQISLDQEQRFKVDQQIASLVETYNDLMDKQDYMEAETVAKQVSALDPNSTISKLLISNARNARRIGEYEEFKQMKEDKFIDNMLTVDEASVPFDDRRPLIFGDVENWEELTKRRQANLLRESEQGLTPAEQAIYEKLKQPVLVDFVERPLREVMRVLSDMTGVMVHIDQAGLAMEGYTSDMPVTLSLPSQISLRSALSLLLNTHNLDFQVRNEVLVITSARSTAASNRQVTYRVKDLVIPIPNFVNDYNSGMAGALRQAYESAGRGLIARTAAPNLNGNVQLASASLDPNAPVLGQLNAGMAPGGNMGPNFAGGNLPPQFGGGFGSGTGPMMGSPMGGGAPLSMGSPGALGGGAAMADFDTLINLIQQTVDPDSWLAAGGTSSILPYPSNLSLVVSAPQTTQEKIADLLESLRRLQDLQVTIEVKFITLNDNFFERIGIDFDLRIDDNVSTIPRDDQGPSTVVGLQSAFNPSAPIPFTADLDIGLSQDSFSSTVPPFGGFDPAVGASLGFAILSDLEMFFFMNAAQGDQRTSVLQAPRVTMFDGQFASITDNISRPFVTSLIPVVADFAVAQQPVIVVLAEGTVLNVQATVSPDKRFVRLTLNPNFTAITNVDTFTFEGSSTSSSSTNVLDGAGNVTGETDDDRVVVTGTTVQQPSFATTSVSTTVSVPDGGTILLGGIKRMREGRLERGVPILSKIPYVSRLFKNTAIGRETSTLMMTVTPRIIIQEEEEEYLGVSTP